jgi:hypothetical protein
LIAAPDASDQDVKEAVNDTLKAIAASLLMEQVLAPRFEFRAKAVTSDATEGYDYGADGYVAGAGNIGQNTETGAVQLTMAGLVELKTREAKRIVDEDLNELVTSFVQDKTAIERGMFDPELVPEELTHVRFGKIIKDRYPDLDDNNQEGIRQRAVAALNFVQGGKGKMQSSDGREAGANTALIDGMRRFALEVRDLDVDLIDRINPFSQAYAILAKTLDEESLKQVAAVIAARKITFSIEEARELAVRALAFKKERGRLPSITSQDEWEKRMAEGVAFLARKTAEANNG